MPTARQPARNRRGLLVVAWRLHESARFSLRRAPIGMPRIFVRLGFASCLAVLDCGVCFRQRLKNGRDKKGTASFLTTLSYVALSMSSATIAAFSRSFSTVLFLSELTRHSVRRHAFRRL